jgi:tRNA threonylcarbamoyladenosine biosynthesis protein TsaB
VKLLAIDTATEHCSVACWRDAVIARRAAVGTQAASGQVLAMVTACLDEAGLTLAALDAIAFGCGPGGFTGVRLAASVTQGLAFASGKPVLPVSNLRAVAQHALTRQRAATHVLVCQDARMGEVYWAPFIVHAGRVTAAGPERVGKPAGIALPEGWAAGDVTGAGSGFDAFAELAPLAHVLSRCHSRAEDIAELAAQDGLVAALPAEQALPVYVRNDVAVPSAR